MSSLKTKEEVNRNTRRSERACPVCEKEESVFLLSKEGKSFVRCRECRLVYEHPLPLPEENQEFYQQRYYDGLKDQLAGIQHARNSLFEPALAECEAYRKFGRLLDIGSGCGDFLKAAQDKGWEAWGIEPSEKANAVAQQFSGSRAIHGTVENAHFEENYFDVITLWNVLDCFPDPASALHNISRWLSPQGIVMIRTPNVSFHLGIFRFFSWFRPLLEKIGWKKDTSVFHVVNFEAATLRCLLKENGLNQIQISNGAPTPGDPYQISSVLSLVSLGKTFMYAISILIAFLSGDRLLTGSVFMVRASKDSNPHPIPLSIGEGEHEAEDKKMQTRIWLKGLFLHLLAALGYLLGLPVWFKILGKDRQIRILLYHSVDEFKKGDMNVRASQFQTQMEFLKKHYDVLSFEEVIQRLSFPRKRESNPRSPIKAFGDDSAVRNHPAVAVTFDDGYENNYRIAYPILRNQKVNAAIFLLTGGEENGRRTTHLGDDAWNENNLMEWPQVKEMSDSGMIFGSHGETHRRMKSLLPEELSQEIISSKKKIESEISKPVRFFSYPYGTFEDFDGIAKQKVREAGYDAALSANFGMNGPETDRFELRRIGIEAGDTLFTFRAKLNGALSLLSLFTLPFVRKMIRWLDSLFLRPGTQNKGETEPVLLVSVDFPPHVNGVSTIARELSVRISQQRKNIFVIGPKDAGDKEFDADKSYRIFRFPGYQWGYFRFLPVLFLMPYVIFRYGIRKIFVLNIAYGGVLSWAISFIKPLDYVLFAYGYEFEKVKRNNFMRQFYQKIYARAKAIVTCSELVRQRLIEFGVSADKIKVLYPAVDLNCYFPCEVPRGYLEEKKLNGRDILLTVGRLVERKGHDQVIKALPKIIERFPNVLYCIVGVGEDEEKIRAQVQTLHVENHVRFMGKVTLEEINYLFNACRVFLMPSREIASGGHIEGFGIVFLEANACKKPVIGGRSGGVLEAIRDNETGFIVDPLSVEEISEKVIFLLSHPEKAQEMGERGFHWVRESFDWEGYIKQAYQLLCEKELSADES